MIPNIFSLKQNGCHLAHDISKCTSLIYIIFQGLTLRISLTCPSGTWFQKCMCPAHIFTCPAIICTSPVKLIYVHCWENNYMPWPKNLPSRARNQKSLCALGQDLHALGMRARLNVEPCICVFWLIEISQKFITKPPNDKKLALAWCHQTANHCPSQG